MWKIFHHVMLLTKIKRAKLGVSIFLTFSNRWAMVKETPPLMVKMEILTNPQKSFKLKISRVQFRKIAVSAFQEQQQHFLLRSV